MTIGKPKGAVHDHKVVVAHKVTAKLALDLHPEGVFWCTADPRSRTCSGRIMRRLLKAESLGLSEGDVSILEGDP
jgi:acyl-coenzyme A synthetase/AMP-(fatty) acid ligase